MSSTLFDPTIPRTPGKRKQAETSYQFLNRSADPTFEQTSHLLEAWFQAYPTEDNQHLALRERLKSDTTDHSAAFFELYCHALLRAQNMAVTIEPPLTGGKNTFIDFLAVAPDRRRFRLEATVVCDPDDETATRSNRFMLSENLNKIPSPAFRFSLNVLEGSRKPPKTKEIQQDVRKWLATLDPADVAANPSGLHLFWYGRYEGWEISLHPHVRTDQDRNAENVIGPHSGGWAPDTNRVRQKLEAKASHYGKLDLPFIIAVDVQALLEIARNSGLNTLSESPEDSKSFWARHPKVSAVLLVNELFPWSCARREPLLVHNARATCRLDTDLWKGPQYIWDEMGKEWMKLPGTPIHELLGLPATWPNVSQP